MIVLNAAYGIIVRDLSRALRQKGRLVGGLALGFDSLRLPERLRKLLRQV